MTSCLLALRHDARVPARHPGLPWQLGCVRASQWVRLIALLLVGAFSLPAWGSSAPPSAATASAPRTAPSGPGPSGAKATTGDLTRFNPSIVRVEARIPPEATTVADMGTFRVGSGIILDEQTVLTIGYVTLEADQVTIVTASGKRIPASVAAQDHVTGLSLIRAALILDGRPLRLGDSDSAVVRQKVLTLGHGEPEATEIFVLSRKPYASDGEYLLETPILTAPAVNNWSGAALINEEGSLIGVGSLIISDVYLGRGRVPGNLWVPVNVLKPVLTELLAKGRRTTGSQPWLGIDTESVRGSLVVTDVRRNSPAERAGMREGDIVAGVAGERVAGQADFYRKLRRIGPAGSVVPLRLVRGGEVRDVTVKSMDAGDALYKPTGI